MVELSDGDIFASGAEALVNPVNCAGTMGRGLALRFRQEFPECVRSYARACRTGELRPGRVLVHRTGLAHPPSPALVIHLPTKRHWRDRSRLEDVADGLAALARELRLRKVRSVAVPALGCGLGGLSWDDVLPMIGDALGGVPGLRVLAHPPRPRGRGAPLPSSSASPPATPS